MIDNCLYCGSATLLSIIHLANGKNAVTCGKCGLTRTIPVPSAEYSEVAEYFENYLLKEKLFRAFSRKLLDFVLSVVQNGRLLEVGCSVGFFLEEAKRAGFSVNGVELNEKAATLSKGKDFDVRNCMLREAGFPSHEFDVVVMSHVLEHIQDLREFLADIKVLLRPGGKVIVSQPTPDGIVPKMQKKKWYGWVPNEHVWHFTPKTLSLVFAENGFDVVKVERNSMYYSLWPSSPRAVLVALVARTAAVLGLGDQFYLAATVSEKDSL
ncbi:class I SAM-dependent methyltransferase [Geobacter grbiciae]|uniref:class I SAM-dependent methyltransferase n=1 Tax=Geobacter grbiciae TaxID=155042 RepID=UPI001C019768|nr:class I SAM-dependent methyltransferase [Geobacter grbiciae]MBT1075039.1 methyltransferase domain-containing protein [Geobacter grbiciae]